MHPDGQCPPDGPVHRLERPSTTTGGAASSRRDRVGPATSNEEGDSVYSLHKLLWDIRRDRDLKSRYLQEPDGVLDEYGIDGEWRDLMKNLDFKSMYERGINPYLLYFCAIQLEVDRADYYAQIRGEKS
jgi:hypothetical protein